MGFAKGSTHRARIPDSQETQSGRKPLRRCGNKPAGRLDQRHIRLARCGARSSSW